MDIKRLKAFKEIVAHYTMLQGIVLKETDDDKFVYIKDTLNSAGVENAFDDIKNDYKTSQGQDAILERAKLVTDKLEDFIGTQDRKFKMTIEVDGELGSYLASLYDVVQSLPIDIRKQDLKEDIVTSGFIQIVSDVIHAYGEKIQEVAKKGFNNRSWATTDKTNKE